jgi:hypothetical protein
MSIQSGTHKIGPSNGSLKIKTGREGAAAKMGHDLVLAVGSWEATVDVGDSTSIELTADPGSIEVLEGSGGAKPLSDKDKADIKKSTSGKVLGSSPITFSSSDVTVDDGSVTAKGDLSINGKSNSISVPLALSPDGTAKGNVKLSQKDYGIKQFSAMMGALKVKNDIEVLIEAQLPTD